MIKLIDTRGREKEFPMQVAEKALRDSIIRKRLKQNYWSLLEDSEYKLKDGKLVLKAKRKKREQEET